MRFYLFKGDPVWKVVFIAFFQGEQLKAKVKKICEGFGFVFFSFDDTVEFGYQTIRYFKHTS